MAAQGSSASEARASSALREQSWGGLSRPPFSEAAPNGPSPNRDANWKQMVPGGRAVGTQTHTLTHTGPSPQTPPTRARTDQRAPHGAHKHVPSPPPTPCAPHTQAPRPPKGPEGGPWPRPSTSGPCGSAAPALGGDQDTSRGRGWGSPGTAGASAWGESSVSGGHSVPRTPGRVRGGETRLARTAHVHGLGEDPHPSVSSQPRPGDPAPLDAAARPAVASDAANYRPPGFFLF